MMYTNYLKNQPLTVVDNQTLQNSRQMLMDDLEESNEAGIINEQMEANVSKQVDIVSALGDSNIVSNRDVNSDQQNQSKAHKNEQVYFSYGAIESPKQKSYNSTALLQLNHQKKAKTEQNDQSLEGSGDIRSSSIQS